MPVYRLSYRLRLLILLCLSAGYVAAFLIFYPVTRTEIGVLVALPVAMAAWFFGLRAGLIASIVAILVNQLLITLTGDSVGRGTAYGLGMLFDYVVMVFFVIALGMVYELRVRFLQENSKRREAEQVERQSNAELEAVYRASLQLTSTLELKPIFDTIITQVTTLLHLQEVHIFLCDGENLTFGAAFWDGERRDTALRIPRPNGFTHKIASTRERLIVTDMSIAPIFKGRDWKGSVVGSPLCVGETVYGVMNVGFAFVHEFTESELRVIGLMADQAALAIRNAEDYERARDYAGQLEQRVAERTVELLREKEGAEALINNSFDVILRLNVDGTIQRTNPAFRRVFGIEHEQGRAFASLFQDKSLIDAALKAAASEHVSQQLEVAARREQGEFTADLVLVPLESGEMICNLRDVTERKRAEMRQLALTQGLRQVLAISYRLIASPDIDSLWKQAVELARDVLGVERCSIFIELGDHMVGTYGTSLQGETTDEHNQNFFKGERSWERLEHILSFDTPAWEVEYNARQEWNGQVMTDLPGGWVGVTPIHSAYRFIGLFYNDSAISNAPFDEIRQQILSMYCSFLGSLYEHKSVEEEVQRTLEREHELSELKSRFTSMISHELRTPLATIQLASDLLKSYNLRLTDESRLEHIEKIQAQVRHLTTMLEDVLTFTRGEQDGLQLRTRRIDLRTFCIDLCSEVGATNTDHQIVFLDTMGNWSCVVDPKLLRQAVLNLLLNAVKFSPEGSTVTVALQREGTDAVICVADHGIGIPEADQPHIFELFFRARNVSGFSGTGLGLAIVRQIAEAHHGTVSSESREGQGATFALRIPLLT